MRIFTSVFAICTLLNLSGICQPLIGKSELIKRNIATHETINTHKFLHDPQLYSDCWDTLPQPQFWRQVINLPQDTAIINVASTRQVLGKIGIKQWYAFSDLQKTSFKDSLRRTYGLAQDESIFITAGKREFYSSYKKVVPNIERAIQRFNETGTDPWFAQTILLIESPGKMQKSSVGAYGPFQLMKPIAVKFGLKVNKYVDEREDFDKSAVAAAKLIGRVCVPQMKKILDAKCVEYNEHDLWFKLLVLHAYHAGSGNVASVLNKINPTVGGMARITEMWRTTAGGFKNASQNYSQIALAALLRFDDVMYYEKDTVYLVEGDKMFKKYKSIENLSRDSLYYLSACLKGYESDLIDGTVPLSYFLSKISVIEREVVTVCTKEGCKKEVIEHTVNNFKYSDEQLNNIGEKLMSLRRFNEAIEIFKLAAHAYPNSQKAYVNLVEAYKITGNKQLAMLYSKKVDQPDL